MNQPPGAASCDVAIVGAGAAGLFAALAAAGALREDGTVGPVAADAPKVMLLDGQEEPGRKILISGGGRCNVTNETVTEADFWSADPKLVRNALRAFGPDETRAFFRQAGVPLHAESLGKVFPDSGQARDVLRALQEAVDAAGVECRYGWPVTRIEPDGDGWLIDGLRAGRVIVATGGRSVPATGSTGFGLELAGRLGHDLVPQVPALAAIDGAIGSGDLAGVTVPAIVTVGGEGHVDLARAGGSLLFTHRGVTGPAALDVSGAIEQAFARGETIHVTADLWGLTQPDSPMGPYLDDPKLPGCCLRESPRATPPAEADAWLAELAGNEPRLTVTAALARLLPRRLAEYVAWPHPDTTIGQLRREDRREVATNITQLRFGVTGTAGYAKAEVTSGGVRLSELARGTLESSLAPGLFFCGEVCDATGRLGGFNFQWAWTSGYLAGAAAATDA